MRTDHDPTMEHLRTVGQRGAWAVVRHRGRLVGVVTLADILARPVPGRPVPQLRGPFPRHLRLLASLWVWQLMHPDPSWWPPTSR
jgi:hypothetical protein